MAMGSSPSRCRESTRAVPCKSAPVKKRALTTETPASAPLPQSTSRTQGKSEHGTPVWRPGTTTISAGQAGHGDHHSRSDIHPSWLQGTGKKTTKEGQPEGGTPPLPTCHTSAAGSSHQGCDVSDPLRGSPQRYSPTLHQKCSNHVKGGDVSTCML